MGQVTSIQMIRQVLNQPIVVILTHKLLDFGGKKNTDYTGNVYEPITESSNYGFTHS